MYFPITTNLPSYCFLHSIAFDYFCSYFLHLVLFYIFFHLLYFHSPFAMKPIKAVQCSVTEDKFMRMNGWISWSMPTFSEVTKDSHVNPQSGQLSSLIDSALLLHKHTYTYIIPAFQTRMATIIKELFIFSSLYQCAKTHT